jgi:NADH-quinone oxidoreductase subunit L
MRQLLWLIPALSLAGFLVQLVLGRVLGDPKAGWVATAAVAGSFVVTVATFVDLWSKDAEGRLLTQHLFSWVPAGNLKIGMGFLADPLSVTMCLFVTGVGALIHMYAVGYMQGDAKFSKFFLYLNLFVFSMLMLVLGDNLLVTFLGWEGVGACSYFLISFWHDDPSNASAGKKAFVTNRIGDWGFMVGTFLTWTVVGSLNYVDISAAANAGKIVGITAVAMAVLFLIGAAGKSAQLPLFVWLPDAMAGPTPVSALIHAATMVTSGVYLLVRLNPVLVHAGWANDLIAWVGGITALVAATIAVSQNDIKKVLAYSTVSQLGYLFLAVGTHNYTAAIFHMVTHAFFKALLFLGSGSVINNMAHDQDMRHYGNLRKYMPITAGTFIVGWLAIAGIPPFSGFWSKDEILSGAFQRGGAFYVLWIIGLVAALLTAFYMTRQVIMTFFGEEKWRHLGADELAGEDHQPEEEAHAHGSAAAGEDHHHGLTPDFEPTESSWIMTVPLVLLAGLAIVGGALNLPFTRGTELLARWLEPVVGEADLPHGATLWTLVVIAVVIAVVGILAGLGVYVQHRLEPEVVEQDVFAHGWYIDETYAAVAGGPGRRAFDAMAWFDRNIIDGAVNGVAFLVGEGGALLRRFQSGRVRGYALGMACGAVLLLGYVAVRMGF